MRLSVRDDVSVVERDHRDFQILSQLLSSKINFLSRLLKRVVRRCRKCCLGYLGLEFEIACCLEHMALSDFVFNSHFFVCVFRVFLPMRIVEAMQTRVCYNRKQSL